MMPNSRPRKLSLSKVKAQAKKTEQMIKVEFEDNTYLHINRHFAPEKINTMLASFSEFMMTLDQAGRHYDSKQVIDFLMLHVFKFFSSLGTEIPDDMETKLQVFQLLSKSDYAEKLAEAYDPAELAKVYERIEKLQLRENKSKQFLESLREGVV